MERHEEVRAAVVDIIKERGTQVGQEFSMYAIGVPLIEKGFREDELAAAIEQLVRDKVAEIVRGTNGLRLLHPL